MGMAQNSLVCRDVGIGKYSGWNTHRDQIVEGLEHLASESKLDSLGHRKHV